MPRDDQPRKPHRRRGWLALVIGVIVVVGAFVVGVWPRLQRRDRVRTETVDLAVPYVSVARPERASPSQQIVLPGDAEAYLSAPIFARTNGYLKKWYVDIGAHVKRGQLLATIATPEVDQQLQQARATVTASEANLRLAETTATRYTELRKSNAVSQQDLDNAEGTLKASQGTVEANRASVRQLEQLQSFEQVRAPFDGVITVRNTDVGKLITAGSTGGPQAELFHIVQADTLRVYINVPEAYAQLAQPGLTAELTLAAIPGQRFTGVLVRTARAIDPATRTLRSEIRVENPAGTLFAGSFAAVTLRAPTAGNVFVIAVETLLFRKEGLNVATVRDGKIVLKPIAVGHDFGDRIEVVHGLDGTELIVESPSDSIASGDRVKVAQPSAPSPAPVVGAN